MAKLTPWTLPESYFGETWDGYLIAPVGRNRDSELLTESNWQAQLKTLEATLDPVSDPWQIVRENHWACGWIEWVAINPDASETIAAMEKLADRLAQYPVLNEDDWSEREYESAKQSFDRWSLREIADQIGATFMLKPRTIERIKALEPQIVLGFMLDKVGTVEIRAEGGGASFVFNDIGDCEATREDLARFLWCARHGV